MSRRAEPSDIPQNSDLAHVKKLEPLSAINNFIGVAFLTYSTLIIYFLVFGGFEYHFAGIRVKMNNLDKPTLIVAALALFYILTIPGWPVFKMLAESARKLTVPVLIIFALGLGVRMAYLSYTDINTRTHDVVGHIQYIEHVVKENNLPFRGECWQCYHPPLYYGLTAGVYHFMSGLGVDRDHMWTKLQLWSVVLYMIFLYYAALLLKRYTNSRYFYIMGAALLVFWPVGVMHSVRIGNDILLYPVYAAGLYYLALWDEEGRTRDIYIATALGAATLAIKTNGIVLLGVIGLVVLYRLYSGSDKKAVLKQMAVMTLIVVIGASAGFYRTVAEKFMDKGENWLVGNMNQLPPKIFVGNNAGNYLYFDIPTFIREPFTDPWNDKYGRQYFFNFLLKSGLFTENQINLKINRATASLMSALLLMFIAYSIIYTMSMDRESLGKFNIILLNAGLLLTAAILFRIKIPAACSNDFRYILPIMISLVVLVVTCLERLREKGFTALEYVGHASVWAFIVSSTIFLINPTISNQ